MKIIWKERAKDSARQAFVYCRLKFGKRIMLQFKDRLFHQTDLLSLNPLLGKRDFLLEDRRDHVYRSLLVHKHFKVVYYIDESEDTVYIVALWDVRREPREQAGDMRENMDNMK